MDNALVRGEAHANSSVCGSSGVASPVQRATMPPPRPAVPPKPGSSKISLVAGSTSPPFAGGKQGHDFTRRHSLAEPTSSTDAPPFQRKLHVATNTANFEGVTSPTLRPVLTSPQISPGSGTAHPCNKPALPPKPVVSPNVLNSPPVTKFPLGKTPPKFPTQFSSVDVANGVSGSGQLSKTTSASCVAASRNETHPVLRTKPPLSPLNGGDPLLSPRVLSPPQPRPSSEFFNFSSPIQNLSSANFPSTSADLNKVGGGPSPQNLQQIRAKSASLGRNITFPFSSPTSSNATPASTGTGFFARKSATLSKFLPLDLQLGSSPKATSTTPAVVSPSKPKPNSLSLNPFIIQQQQQKSQTMSQTNSVLNFGRSIAFSPESPLPPPPPPRLKKKLSPVNSIGSPTTPTSPLIETSHSLAPNGPLPPPPPFSPGKQMESFHESAEDVRTAIYAEVNKEKKWETRRQREVERKLSLDSSTQCEVPLSSKVEESSQNVSQTQVKCEKPDNEIMDECEAEAVKSWLRSHIENGVVVVSTETSKQMAPPPPNTNPFRSVTPTYQATQTGHIYETIGDNLDGLNNNNKNDNNMNVEKQAICRNSSTNELSENQSFLFKLVINPKSGNANCDSVMPENENTLAPNENEENRKNNNCTPDAIPEDATVHSSESVTSNGASTTDAVLLSAATSPPTNAASYLIPTVVPDLTQKPPDDLISPTSISSSVLSKDSSNSQFTSNSSFQSIVTVSSTTTLGSSIADTPPPRQENGILRRRSWNCDRMFGSGSPTPSDSSSTASSISNLPYHHRRDRSYTSGVTNRDSLLLVQESNDWEDEGDLSNGVLADTETSDAPLRSSAEDVNLRKSVPKGFSSRRLVNSIFSSFGKSGLSSSGSSGSGQRKAGKRGKDKTMSLASGETGVARLGRQISDSVVTTAMISGPMLPSSVSFDSAIGPPQRAHPIVQFAPFPGEQVGESEGPVGGDACLEQRDNESVSSSESIAESGSTPDAIPEDATVHSSESVTSNGASTTDAVLLSAATSPPTNAASYLIPTVVPDLTQKPPDDLISPTSISSSVLSKDSSNSQFTSNSSFQSIVTVSSTTTLGSSIADTPPPRQENGILRRRSWNCDRMFGSGSPTPSDSSSTASSISNLPYHHRRDRSYTSGVTNRDSLLLVQESNDWEDEGDLSNGVLADTETSDAPLRSSAEDVNLRKSGPKGFSSRRLVNSIFSSFGKSGLSSSGSSGSGQRKAGKRGKDKTMSLASGEIGVARLGRQISDSVVTTAMISGPMLPSSVSFDSAIGPPQRAHPIVQFAPFPGEQVGESEEPVGGDACLEQRDNESVSSSESIAGSGSSTSVSAYEDILAELGEKERKSFFVAREILTSERTFVDWINLITIDFPKTLEDAKRFHGSPVISKQDLDTILGGLPNLKQVNEDLLKDLEERLANWRQFPKIADILVKKGPFLKLYASYIKDFQKNSMYLDNCCQRYPLFADAVKAFEMSDRCNKLGLKHYMLKPVQRMPQYKLLLDDYLKYLDESSDDYQDTIKGIAIVKDVAEHANEAIRLQVNAEKLLHLQYRLSTGSVILKSDRQLLKEGELLKVCRKELQPRFFALMNDCLLCMMYHAAAGAQKDLTLRYELPLAGMRVSLSTAEDFQNEFSVISIARSFSLVAKSPRERDEWMKALNTAIEDNVKKRAVPVHEEDNIGKKLGKEAPLWIADSRVTMCQLCTAAFTMIFRRHHCRACGIIVCGNCSSGEAPLEYKKYSACRVCDSCYEYLLDEFDKKYEDISPNFGHSRTSIRDRFKKVTPNVSKRATKIKRNVPSRLEVHANSSGSKISGYLKWRENERKSWKQRWFVLIDRVLYIYAASEDIVAIKTKPLLGWEVHMDKPDPQQEGEDQAFFRLTHTGQQPMLFQANSSSTAEKWVAAMSEAVVLQ